MAKPPKISPRIYGKAADPGIRSGGPKGGLKRLARQHAREVLEKLLAIIAATPATGPSQAQMSAFARFLDFFDSGAARAKAAEPPLRCLRSPNAAPPSNERKIMSQMQSTEIAKGLPALRAKSEPGDERALGFELSASIEASRAAEGRAKIASDSEFLRSRRVARSGSAVQKLEDIQAQFFNRRRGSARRFASAVRAELADPSLRSCHATGHATAGHAPRPEGRPEGRP